MLCFNCGHYILHEYLPQCSLNLAVLEDKRVELERELLDLLLHARLFPFPGLGVSQALLLGILLGPQHKVPGALLPLLQGALQLADHGVHL